MSQALDKEVITAANGVGVVAAAVRLIRAHAGDRQPLPRLSAAARTRLVAYRWSPDLAGLETCVRRALARCEGDTIEPSHLALDPASASAGLSHSDNRAHKNDLLAERDRRHAAAVRLGIAPETTPAPLEDAVSEVHLRALETAS